MVYWNAFDILLPIEEGSPEKEAKGSPDSKGTVRGLAYYTRTAGPSQGAGVQPAAQMLMRDAHCSRILSLGFLLTNFIGS